MPWFDLKGAEIVKLKAQGKKCPSGILGYNSLNP
jgi:hypothetical protein|tara:strand:- start:599 stop:700 length:102 start_codon:yes stop_codon:yes gene_type:complete